MKTRTSVLFASVFVAMAACKPRQETASTVKAEHPVSGKFVVAEPRPNPLKRTDFVDVARKLEQILKASGNEKGLGLAGTDGEDAPNNVASLASISWTLGDLKLTSQALKDLGEDAVEAQKLDELVRQLDAELNKKALELRNQFLLNSQQRDAEVAKNRQKALAGATDGAPADVARLREARNDALNRAVQQVGELKTGTEGFAGMECNVGGGSPTALASAEFSEEDAFAVGKGLEESSGIQHLGRGEGVCFNLTPGYPLFVLLAQKRCASGFQPDDPRVTLHTSADTGQGEAFAYVLPPGEMLESLCFSRSGEATMPVISEVPQPPPQPNTMAGAFKRMVSSIFSTPEDCEGVVRSNANLCTNSECRAVTSGKISDCYSKDCRAIILKRSSACGSTDCRGIIRRVIDDCVSNYCRAIVGNNATMCREGETL